MLIGLNDETVDLWLSREDYFLVRRISERYGLSLSESLCSLIRVGRDVERIQREHPRWDEWLRLYLSVIHYRNRVAAVTQEIGYLSRILPQLKESLRRAEEEYLIAKQIHNHLEHLLRDLLT